MIGPLVETGPLGGAPGHDETDDPGQRRHARVKLRGEAVEPGDHEITRHGPSLELHPPLWQVNG
ncbi:MAG TPA: hypothetical protein DCP11_07155 [Microbacteriaceae bacterium]|nr:hypothetical protein [Microbacteriaceae bacterium]